jgi:hypothetical protein
VRTFLLIAVLGACAPDVPSVADRAHASDLLEQTALEQQLVALPGVTGAHALLHRAVTDPLTGAASAATARVLVIVDRATGHAVIEAAAHRLAPTATIVLVDAPAAPAGPGDGKPVLAIAALVVILGVAGYVAWKTRPSS